MAGSTAHHRSQPFISIVIPVFNMADGIRRCLRSVVDQLVDDIEVLVVDDGSTDNTGMVVKEFAAKESKIRYLFQENAGVSSARNAGIEAARGAYLLFIDADDEVENNYLQNILERAKESRADLLVWGIKRYRPNGRIEEWKPRMEGLYNRKSFITAFPAEHYGRHKGLYGFVPNKLVKKELVNRFRLRFDTTLNLMEDYDFFLGCYAHCETILCFGETGYHYLASDGSDKPANRKSVSYPQLIGVQDKCVDLLNKEGAWTIENEKLLFRVISDLSLSLFLETRDWRYSSVKSQLEYIWNDPYCISAIKQSDTCWMFLKRQILERNVFRTWCFVLAWRSYLSIRTEGKS